MMNPMSPNHPSDENDHPVAGVKTRRVLNIRILLGTFLALMALGISAIFWRAYQVRRQADALTERAESLAKKQEFASAVDYYSRYLELRPDDANARMRRAELYDQAPERTAQRTIEFYQEALSSSKAGLDEMDRIKAQRRLTELLLQIHDFATALTEANKLAGLETGERSANLGKGVDSGKLDKAVNPPIPREEWYAPSLKALALAGEHRANKLGVPNKALEEAFAAVLEPDAGLSKPHVLPDVYLLRNEYELQKAMPGGTDRSTGRAYLKASKAGNEYLTAALAIAPNDVTVLVSAARAARRDAAAAINAAREGSAAEATEFRTTANASYAEAIDYYQRALHAVPTDPRAYDDLGQLYMSLGNVDQAIQIWRRGLKEIPRENLRVEINLSLADALLQLGSLSEADNVLQSLNTLVAKLDPKTRLTLQRLVDLRSGKLAFLRGRYEEAIHLVTDLASGKALVQGEEIAATPQMRYDAWCLIGQGQAILGNWDPALEAFKQAASLSPRETAPHLAAAQTCIAAGRRDAAITAFQQALEVVDAASTPRAELQLKIYASLTELLEAKYRQLVEQEKHGGLREDQLKDLAKEQQSVKSQVDLYDGRRKAIIAASPQITLLAVNQAALAGNLDLALDLGRAGVTAHPDDSMAYMALGRAEQVNKHPEKALEAYDKAIQTVKDVPASQLELAELLLGSGNPADAAEGEKVLRNLMPRYSPAVLQMVRLLASRQKFDEALALAQDSVTANPKDPVVHTALGAAWLGKHDNAKAEVELQEAVRLAPNAPLPARILLEFYVDTGRVELAREMLDKFLGQVNLRDVERELFLADMLVRIGDRKKAKQAYQKAVELAKDDPLVAMRLAEFLLRSGDPGDEVEGEKVLRRTMMQHDPARRRLAELLVARGGEAEWEEAQKLLESSAGNPIAGVDRFVEARSLMRRGGEKNLEKAATICQELLAQAKLVKQSLPEVSLLLAEIRELQGNVDDARNEYIAFLGDKNQNPSRERLADYIRFLLRRGPATEADERLKQLERIAPDDVTTVELRARWLRDEKRITEIEPLVESHAQKALARLDKSDAPQESQLARIVGDLYQRIELYSAAERWYRRLQALAANLCEPLVMSLAMQGRIKEAAALCEDASKDDPSVRPVLVLSRVLMSGRATPQDMADAEPYLSKALEAHQDQPELLVCLAAVRLLQDRPKDAVELYRQMLKLQPRNVAVLNNLATVLAEQPEAETRQEAMDTIDRAIELAGPRPDLLDTKGMVYFYDGKPERAVGPLQAAAEGQNPDPRFSFHLAAACWKLGQLDRARAALRRSRDAQLEHQLLTNKDRQLLAELDRQIQP